MERRVTQETFDQAVLENMSDFDLSKEDAIKDTIQQFVSQGVNLSAIDVRVRGIVVQFHHYNYVIFSSYF